MIIPRPDWLIFAAQSGLGVMVVASDKVIGWEMLADFGFLRNLAGVPGVTVEDAGDRYEFNCSLGSFVVAYGANYAEALQKLFGTWSPPEPSPGRAAIERGQRQLPPMTS